MSCGTTKAPEGMTFSEVFASLYTEAKSPEQPKQCPWSGGPIRTHEEAMRVFFTYCKNGYCETVRGKQLNIDFSNFPSVATQSYDNRHGEGAANKALYEKPLHFRIKSADSFKECRKCDYFQEKSIRNLRSNQWQEFHFQFKRCKIFTENRSDALQRFQWHPFLVQCFKKCTADYTLVKHTPLEMTEHHGISCEEAYQNLSKVSEDDFYINKFRICLSTKAQNSGIRSCRDARGSMEVTDVLEILSRRA